MSETKLILGDCLEKLKDLESNSVDSVVTDPPAGISFMGKEWDDNKGGKKQWIEWLSNVMRECLRVLKPGGHALVWALPRTSHWTATAVEDAGFEIRDNILNLYDGSKDVEGFMASLSLEQKQSLEIILATGDLTNNIFYQTFGTGFPKSLNVEKQISDLEVANKYKGFGTALKPAAEHWILARKPLIGTVAENVLQHGTGGLNIDGCRVSTEDVLSIGSNNRKNSTINFGMADNKEAQGQHPSGRFPANVMHDGSDAVLKEFPETTNGTFSGKRNSPKTCNTSGKFQIQDEKGHVGDTGSAARFFYCAKTSKTDRNEGLDDLPDSILARSCQAQAEAKRGNVVREEGGAFNKARITKNNHPTVKSTSLMQWLCRLVTPPNGTVLDPFMGSGSTGKACMLEGFNFIGIEKEPEYFEIAQTRIQFAKDKKEREVIQPSLF